MPDNLDTFINTKNHADICIEQGRLMVSGHLDFKNAVSVYKKSLPLIRECSSLHFDFAKLEFSNSVLIALMVEWVKLAKEQNKSIQFSNLSEKISSIAKLSGLQLILE